MTPNQIKQWMKKNGIKTEELATMIGVSYATVHRALAGDMTRRTLIAISNEMKTFNLSGRKPRRLI